MRGLILVPIGALPWTHPQDTEDSSFFLKNEEQSQQLQAQAQTISAQSQQIDQLTYQVNALKRHRYGKRSEKTQEDSHQQAGEETTPSNSPDAHTKTKNSRKSSIKIISSARPLMPWCI